MRAPKKLVRSVSWRLPTRPSAGGWFGSSEGIVGVSAETGEYRFLDLPDRGDRGWSLAPDGRHVAYWTTGQPSGTPNTHHGDVITGVAIYDTVTGGLARHEIDTAHGVSVDELAWSDGSTLLIHYGQFMVGDDGPEDRLGSGNDSVWLRWPLAAPAPVPLSGAATSGFPRYAGSGWMTDYVRGDKVWLIDADDGSRDHAITFDRNYSTEPVPDPSGDRLVAIPGSRTPNRLGLIEVADGRATTRIVPGSERTFEVLSWLDPHQVVVVRARDARWDVQYVSVLDVDDGAVADRVRLTPGTWAMTFATDLFAFPTRPAMKPPEPVNPWAQVVAVSTIISVAAGALLLRRRRRVRV